ncbi:MAG: HNH endonuclease [Planctomycetes bacterium]|nr:HNH endonuclease [Planctomycetota bacterium]
MATFTRRRTPPDGKPYRWYKGCLRLDFECRCAYCLLHESDNQGPDNFVVDHFRPKARFEQLERRYANLYYACQLCNRTDRKGDKWPSPEEADRGERFVDPCSEDWEDRVEFLEDGSARALTPGGAFSLRTIGLDRAQLRIHRRKFPREYVLRSVLAAAKRRLKNLASLVSANPAMPAEARSELAAIQERLARLETVVLAAWNSKKPFPPEPICPY